MKNFRQLKSKLYLNLIIMVITNITQTLLEKCPIWSFFFSLFSRIWTRKKLHIRRLFTQGNVYTIIKDSYHLNISHTCQVLLENHSGYTKPSMNKVQNFRHSVILVRKSGSLSRIISILWRS